MMIEKQTKIVFHKRKRKKLLGHFVTSFHKRRLQSVRIPNLTFFLMYSSEVYFAMSRLQMGLALFRAFLVDCLIIPPFQQQSLRCGIGLWTNKFPVQNYLKKIFINRQNKSVPKIGKYQKSLLIDSFPLIQKTYFTTCPKKY